MDPEFLLVTEVKLNKCSADDLGACIQVLLEATWEVFEQKVWVGCTGLAQNLFLILVGIQKGEDV